MIFRIHYEYKNLEDWVDIEGSTIEDIRKNFDMFVQGRDIDLGTCWSEEIVW